QTMRIGAGWIDSVKKLNVLSVRYLVLSDPVRVAHRALRRTEAKIGHVPRIVNGDSFDYHGKGGLRQQQEQQESKGSKARAGTRSVHGIPPGYSSTTGFRSSFVAP